MLELAGAAAIVSILAALAIPGYRSVMERSRIQTAKNDLLVLGNLIERYRLPHHLDLPDSLADLPGPALLDPWGNPYQYLNFSSDDDGSKKGKVRKDHNLHPLNSEFDLYSMGPDGQSKPPLTASASRDDIIWARDGNFVGKASDF